MQENLSSKLIECNKMVDWFMFSCESQQKASAKQSIWKPNSESFKGKSLFILQHFLARH